MHCDQFEELLSEYMDGSLPQALKRNMDAHRGGCPACTKLVSDMQLIYTAMENMPALDTPPWMHERIMARVEAESATQNKRSYWSNPWSWVGTVTAAAAVVALALIIPQTTQPTVQMSLLSRPAATVTNENKEMPVRAELATASGENAGWVLRLTPQKVGNAEVCIGTPNGQSSTDTVYWKGLANGQPIALPNQQTAMNQALYTQVKWYDNTTTSLWLPQQLLPDGHLAKVNLQNASMEHALSSISASWGVKIFLKGHVQPDVRLNLHTRAASVDQVMTSLANLLQLQVDRPSSDTYVLSQE